MGPALCDADREALEQATRGEALGFESVWPIEQRSLPSASLLSCPRPFLTSVARRTRHLSLGVALPRLGLAQPSRVVEELGALAALRGGLEVALGAALHPGELAAHAAQPRLIEEAASLRRPLRESSWTHDDATPGVRRTCSVRVAVGHVEHAEQAGHAGLPILLGGHLTAPSTLSQLVQRYQRARRESGFGPARADDLTVLMPLYVATTRAQLDGELAHSLARFARGLASRAAMLVEKRAEGAALQPLPLRPERLGDALGIFDTPSGCAERLAQLRDELGVGRVIAWFNPGGLVPHAAVLRSMALFSAGVLPRMAPTSAAA